RRAPASSAFSTSSLTTLAGRSTTSPAAIRLTTASDNWRRGMAGRFDPVPTLPAQPGTRETRSGALPDILVLSPAHQSQVLPLRGRLMEERHFFPFRRSLLCALLTLVGRQGVGFA